MVCISYSDAWQKITSMKTQISTNDDKIAKILQTVTEAQ
jgi:hypothetical protein